MSISVDAVVSHSATKSRCSDLNLLRMCLAFGSGLDRPPARIRLEQAVGVDFAKRLIASVATSRR
jgi:hypothetical protein